ncbi:LPS export ABC transporter permease LptG [Thalassobius sp. I31.1]|uniref:LPS export ABC transporter permease LptG n=1 Tax=Thalassobius sp. I31.1 TaxID=2109912 RepID=UPI000D1A8440|nr:LPS export ABC transporter permease LptG [Thalassobius sp. I31.1]
MKLHLYFARRFLITFTAVFFVFLGILLLVDVAEQLRKFGNLNLGFGEILSLSLLNIPATLYQILPLITILATLALFLGLARSSELVVTRAAGRSALRSLVAPVVSIVLIGAVAVSVLNPIVAATSGEYENRASVLRSGATSTLSISDEGLWLRQGNPDVLPGEASETMDPATTRQTVIHAQEASLGGTQLREVSFISFNAQGLPLERIEAGSAVLENGSWQLTHAKIWPLSQTSGLTVNPERDSSEHSEITLATTLTEEQIRDSFADPSAIGIWELPGFITQLENAGFAARAHSVFLHTELALPLMLVAMVLIGAGFTMRHTRLGQTGPMVLMAILLGFALFFLRNFSRVLGENGNIPIELAAWAPPLVAIMLAMGLLLHMEDG